MEHREHWVRETQVTLLCGEELASLPKFFIFTSLWMPSSLSSRKLTVPYSTQVNIHVVSDLAAKLTHNPELYGRMAMRSFVVGNWS